MSVPYLLRLLCVSFAAFFLVHLALGVLVAAFEPLVSRFAAKMHAKIAARTVFAMRLLPAAISAALVASLCIPSFLRFETERGTEEVGWGCLTAAGMGCAIWLISVVRAVRASARSRRYLRNCRKIGRRLELPFLPAPAWVLDRNEPFVMLAGQLRPELLISRPVLDSLTPEQLAAALDHERAHWTGRDNLKRLLILLAPGLLPGLRGFRGLERSWARFLEWAADDRAVQGDSQVSLSLAAALVRVARMGVAAPAEPLVTSLLADAEELPARVERLLNPAPSGKRRTGWPALWAALAAIVLFAAWQPVTLVRVHHLLESLVH